VLQPDHSLYNHSQCSNNPSHAHSLSPRFAPTYALKGQKSSAVGTALGIEAQNKTRLNGATALIPNSSFLTPHPSFINFCYTSMKSRSKHYLCRKKNSAYGADVKKLAYRHSGF